MANTTGKKFGGRKKGSLNKSTVEAREKAEKLGIDPFEILLFHAAGDWKALGYESGTRVVTVTKEGVEILEDRITTEARISAAGKATEYLLPKLKAVAATVANPDGTPIQHAQPITPEILVQMVKVARGNK